MGVEEIERYNVLADEIRKLGLELQKAENSREIERQEQEQWFLALASDNKAREGFESQLVQRLNAIEREVQLINGALGMNYYPHMCRDGHQQIGHSDSENEMCPLCREIAKNRAQPKRKRERKCKK